jgi:hypothetical protein
LTISTDVSQSKCKASGEVKIREIIRYGIARAASYRIKAQRDVARYVDLMIVFGSDFDCDPRLPWSSSILNDPDLRSPRRKILELHEAAIDYLEGNTETDDNGKQ